MGDRLGDKARAAAARVDAEKLKSQAEHAASAAKEAAVAAREAAQRAKEWAEPRYEHAKEWAKPRAEKVVRASAQKAEPYVAAAGTRAENIADAIHAAIVGSVIPAVVGAVHDVGQKPSGKDDDKGFNWGAVVIPAVVAAAAGAALIAWARRDPGVDGWAGEEDEEWEFAGDSQRTTQVKDSINKAADSAENILRQVGGAAAAAASAAAAAVMESVGPAAGRVKDAAGPAAAKVKEAAGPAAAKVMEAAAPAAAKVKEAAIKEAKKVRETIEAARNKATEGVSGTIDDVEDVWEDEGGAVDDSLTAPIPKPSARKPRAPKEF